MRHPLEEILILILILWVPMADRAPPGAADRACLRGLGLEYLVQWLLATR